MLLFYTHTQHTQMMGNLKFGHGIQTKNTASCVKNNLYINIPYSFRSATLMAEG